jgi:hypothetical protein
MLSLVSQSQAMQSFPAAGERMLQDLKIGRARFKTSRYRRRNAFQQPSRNRV